jgi:hypothetical protein
MPLAAVVVQPPFLTRFHGPDSLALPDDTTHHAPARVRFDAA